MRIQCVLEFKFFFVIGINIYVLQYQHICRFASGDQVFLYQKTCIHVIVDARVYQLCCPLERVDVVTQAIPS